jgi:nucleoside 2-deoxyribosyltransferase
MNPEEWRNAEDPLAWYAAARALSPPRRLRLAGFTVRRGDRSFVAPAILVMMKLYFAGPLFSAAERAWNAELAAALRDAGHEVFLPQDQEPGKDAPGIFATDVAGIDGADALVAIMDGPDPDSGTAWEVGYAYGKKPIVLVRTDSRSQTGRGAPYNQMLTQSATLRLELPYAPMTRVLAEVLDALGRLRNES